MLNLNIKISKPKNAPLPKARSNMRPRPVNPFSLQGKLTHAIMDLEVGQMIKISYDGPDGNVSGRIGAFRKKNPDIKIVTRKLDEDTLGVWRVA